MEDLAMVTTKALIKELENRGAIVEILKTEDDYAGDGRIADSYGPATMLLIKEEK